MIFKNTFWKCLSVIVQKSADGGGKQAQFQLNHVLTHPSFLLVTICHLLVTGSIWV